MILERLTRAVRLDVDKVAHPVARTPHPQAQELVQRRIPSPRPKQSRPRLQHKDKPAFQNAKYQREVPLSSGHQGAPCYGNRHSLPFQVRRPSFGLGSARWRVCPRSAPCLPDPGRHGPYSCRLDAEAKCQSKGVGLCNRGMLVRTDIPVAAESDLFEIFRRSERQELQGLGRAASWVHSHG